MLLIIQSGQRRLLATHPRFEFIGVMYSTEGQPVSAPVRHMQILNSQRGQEASPRYRSLPHAACSSRPVTGQADRGIPQPSVFWTA
ncbi:hypothetical protein ACT48O_005247, partial [Escherichia coli]